MGRRVAALVVVHALARGHPLARRQAVDERRLADAGRAEQDRRPPGSIRAAARRSPRRSRRSRRAPARRARPPRSPRRAERVVEPVDLREHDLRGRAALPDRHEVALDPARVELGPEGRDDEGEVDVRHECLHGSRDRPRCARSRSARQDGSRRRRSAIQSPTATSVPRARTVPAPVADHAGLGRDVQLAAVNGATRPGTRPGSKVFRRAREFQPSSGRSNPGNAKAPSLRVGRRYAPEEGASGV